METACLRIKFTPLLQKNPKNNSKCCLEIVPEISCIQNLEKLMWRQETNFIEYTIPMTYKVILKKQQAIQNFSNEVVKTYHSCVDLLHSSSKSTINLGSGDVSKIISDTFIITKAMEPIPSKEVLIDALKTCDDLLCNYPVSHKTTNTSFRITITEAKESKEKIEDDKENVITKLQQDIETGISNNASLDAITSTENVYPPAFSEIVKSTNSIIYTEPSKRSIIADSKRKLSLSPICSVSTQETPILKKRVASKAVTCKIYDSQKDLVPLGNISTSSDLTSDPTIPALPTVMDISSKKCSSKRFKCRVPPEIRVAEFVQYMEKEILPLKMLLDDILCKCSALGISLTKVSSKQSLLFQTISTDSCSQDITNSEEIKKSNRVVYSIVFDG